MTRLAFICTGNSCRSQMAEAFARRLAKPGVEVYSAGLAPIGLNPNTVGTMNEIGFDISKQRSKNLEAIPKEIDYIVTVCGHANKLCPQLCAKIERVHWEIRDPIDKGSEEEIRSDFRKVRDEIREQVLVFLRGRNLLKP